MLVTHADKQAINSTNDKVIATTSEKKRVKQGRCELDKERFVQMLTAHYQQQYIYNALTQSNTAAAIYFNTYT